MKYVQFEIENFKGISKTKLDLESNLDKNITTLVGLNESGKTTILDAISLLQPKELTNDELYKLIPRSKRSSFTGSVSVSCKIILSNEDIDKINDFLYGQNFRDIDIKDNEFTFTREYIFKEAAFVDEVPSINLKIKARKSRGSGLIKSISKSYKNDYDLLTGFIEENLPPIAYYSNFLYEFPEKIYLGDFALTKDKYKFYRDIVKDILDSTNPSISLSKLSKLILSNKTVENDQADSILLEMSEQVTQAVFSKWNQITKSKKHSNSRIVISPKKESPTKDLPEQAIIEFNLHIGSDKYNINEGSLGFKWFFAFLLLTLFRKFRKDQNEEVLYLLDEPASNLHPFAQTQIMSLLKELGTGNSKLIYATHSHYMVEPKWLSQTYVIKDNHNNVTNALGVTSRKTEIKAERYRIFASQHPKQEEYFRPVLDTLQYQPSKLEMVEPLLITEGKFDFYTYEYFKRHLDIKNEINIYPGGGAGSNTQAIALYLSWSRNFVILLDDDTSGKEAKTKYLERFGKILESKILTYGDISSSFSGKATEKIFYPTDLLKIQKYGFPNLSKYKKNKFNQSIEQLVTEEKVIALTQTTEDNFREIFKAIESKLEF